MTEEVKKPRNNWSAMYLEKSAECEELSLQLAGQTSLAMARLDDADRLRTELEKLEQTSKARIEKLEADLKQAQSLQSMYSNNASKAQKELSEVHDLLNNLPGTLPEKDESAVYGKQEKSLAIRLTHYLIMKGNKE